MCPESVLFRQSREIVCGRFATSGFRGDNTQLIYIISQRCARPRRHTRIEPTLSGQHGFLDRVSERIVMHAFRTNDGVLKGRYDSVSL